MQRQSKHQEVDDCMSNNNIERWARQGQVSSYASGPGRAAYLSGGGLSGGGLDVGGGLSGGGLTAGGGLQMEALSAQVSSS